MKRFLIAALAACGAWAAYAEDIGVTYDANGDATVAAGGEITVGPNGASTNNSQGVTVTFEGGGTIKAIKTDNNGAVQSYHRLWRDYFINGTVTYDGSELASGTAPSFRRSVPRIGLRSGSDPPIRTVRGTTRCMTCRTSRSRRAAARLFWTAR